MAKRGSISFYLEWFIIPKKTIHQAGVILIISVLSLAAINYYINHSNRPSPPEVSTAHFSFIDGTVRVKHVSSNLFEPAGKSTSLNTGDIIVTETNSRAIVVFDDQSIYTINPNSTIILRQLQKDENNFYRVRNEVPDGEVIVIVRSPKTNQTIYTQKSKVQIGPGNSDIELISRNRRDKINVWKGEATVETGQEVKKLGPNQKLVIDEGEIKILDLPPPPRLISPGDNSELWLENRPGNEIPLTWQPVPEADHYKIKVSPLPYFQSEPLIVDRDGIAGTTYKLIQPLGGNFYWCVKAITKDGLEGNWSEVSYFSLMIKNGTESNTVPIRTTRIDDPHFYLVEVEGITSPNAMVKLNDRKKVQADEKGYFKSTVIYPTGTKKRKLIIEATDTNGRVGKIIQIL